MRRADCWVTSASFPQHPRGLRQRSPRAGGAATGERAGRRPLPPPRVEEPRPPPRATVPPALGRPVSASEPIEPTGLVHSRLVIDAIGMLALWKSPAHIG